MVINFKKTSKMQSNDLCEYCGKPLELMIIQAPFRKNKKEMSVMLNCECIMEIQKRKEEQNRKQEMMQILHKRGFQTGKYERMTFKSWQEHKVDMNVIKTAVDYVESVDINNRNWLYQYGKYGLGKTHLSVASGRQIALDRGWSPALFRWAECCSQIQQSWHDTSIKVDWNLIKCARVLVLDDIDKRIPTEWALDKLYEVIDYRYINEIPTIINANHSIAQLLNFWSRDKKTEDLSKAIISRIMGQIVKVIYFKGQDYRLCE